MTCKLREVGVGIEVKNPINLAVEGFFERYRHESVRYSRFEGPLQEGK
jgi:hypothetical protein